MIVTFIANVESMKKTKKLLAEIFSSKMLSRPSKLQNEKFEGHFKIEGKHFQETSFEQKFVIFWRRIKIRETLPI